MSKRILWSFWGKNRNIS